MLQGLQPLYLGLLSCEVEEGTASTTGRICSRDYSLCTVEVSNTGHIIMFKVILKLFAATFSPFFLQKSLYRYFYFSYLIQFTWIGHEKYILFFFKSAGRCYTGFV